MVSRRIILLASVFAWILYSLVYFKNNDTYIAAQELTTQPIVKKTRKMASDTGESSVQPHNSEIELTTTHPKVVKTRKVASDIGVSFVESHNSESDFSGLYHVPDGLTWVTSQGNFLEKISNFNNALDDVRKDIISISSNTTLSWSFVNPTWKLITGTSDNYLDELAKLNNVLTLTLKWIEGTSVGNWSSLNDTNNLIQKYYPITATTQVCNNLTSNEPPSTIHRFNDRCSSVIEDMFEVQSLDLLTLNAVQMPSGNNQHDNGRYWPPHFYAHHPRFITFLHVIYDAAISPLGAVLTNGVKIVPYSCHPHNNKNTKHFENASAIHDEVFTISQYWGGGFFHFTIEDLPKLAPYQEFLVKNNNIKVHVFGNKRFTVNLLEYLGISSNRVVNGSMRARIIYLPRATTCGFAQVPETQLLSLRLRQTIPTSTLPAKTLILIRRKASRHFVDGDKIAVALENLSTQFGLTFFHFRDDLLPPLNVTKDYFNRAALVVAPHGAGLSNLLFSKPGTAVIEGLCNPPHVNLCYMRLMRILGHRYHGLMSRGGCRGHVDIPAAEIEAAARAILEGMKTHAEI